MLALRDISRLASTCKSIHLFFSNTLLLARAAHYVIENPNKANKEKMIAMMEAEPTLITAVITQAKDKVGRLILNKTPFQLAYGAGRLCGDHHRILRFLVLVLI